MKLSKDATPHDLSKTSIEIKYGQMEFLPFVEKYNLPVWFVILLVSFVALKQLGLIYFVKDIWAWLGSIFNQKNVQIAELKKELHEVREELEEIKIKYTEVTSAIRGLRPHFKALGFDMAVLDEIFNR